MFPLRFVRRRLHWRVTRLYIWEVHFIVCRGTTLKNIIIIIRSRCGVRSVHNCIRFELLALFMHAIYVHKHGNDVVGNQFMTQHIWKYREYIIINVDDRERAFHKLSITVVCAYSTIQTMAWLVGWSSFHVKSYIAWVNLLASAVGICTKWIYL